MWLSLLGRKGFTLIKPRRLFLVPFLSLFLIWFFPIGTLSTIAIIAIWYYRNQDNVIDYVKGVKYNKIDDLNTSKDIELV